MYAVGLFALVSLLTGSIDSQGVSPTGKKDGTALYTAGRGLPAGEYEFITQNKKPLSMIDPKNLLEPSQQCMSNKNKKTKFFSLY